MRLSLVTDSLQPLWYADFANRTFLGGSDPKYFKNTGIRMRRSGQGDSTLVTTCKLESLLQVCTRN